ncbi:hypothetical protein GEMRC1_001305 [Eukaryota sp. GEM-RC1]
MFVATQLQVNLTISIWIGYPPQVVRVERLFSAAKKTYGTTRPNLTPASLEKQLFLMYWDYETIQRVVSGNDLEETGLDSDDDEGLNEDHVVHMV